MIGLFSDSHGDLDAFDAAYELLRGKGATRFFFVGGRYADFDEWLAMRNARARKGRTYSDLDFLADVQNFLAAREQVPRPQAFTDDAAEELAQLRRVRERFVRVPERDSLQYRDPSVPNKLVDMIGSTLCCLVHDKNDVQRDDLVNAVVVVHGKGPEPRVVHIGPRSFVCAGTLTGAAEQTCGLLRPAERGIHFSAFRLDGMTIVKDEVISLEKKAKVSVR